MLKILERKKSPAWNYFSIAEDPNFVVCQACNKKVSRGGKNSKSHLQDNEFGAVLDGQACSATQRVSTNG